MDQPGIVSTRPRDYHDALASTSGVVFSNGHVWKENRKMFLSTLNRMGMGDKNKMDMIIEEEVADFCAILKAKLRDVKTELQVSENYCPKGILECGVNYLTFQICQLFGPLVYSVLWRLTFGTAMKQTDKKNAYLINCGQRLVNCQLEIQV